MQGGYPLLCTLRRKSPTVTQARCTLQSGVRYAADPDGDRALHGHRLDAHIVNGVYSPFPPEGRFRTGLSPIALRNAVSAPRSCLCGLRQVRDQVIELLVMKRFVPTIAFKPFQAIHRL